MASYCSSIHTLQYGCKCGKKFSGETKRVQLLLRLHHKKCKYPIPEETSPEPIILSNTYKNKSGKFIQRIMGENQINAEGQISVKSYLGSL